MANPQAEDGHTKIANEVMEALMRTNLSGSEWQMIITVLRKTWGWHKKHDEIALSQFEKATGLHRTLVCRAKKRLVAKNILVVANNLIKFNKNYEQWLVAKSTPLVAKKSSASSQKVKKVVAKSTHTKDIYTKETITKERFGYLNDEKFLGTLKDFLDMRKKINKPATLRAQELILIDLHKANIETAVKMLEQSIRSSWQDVYPLKDVSSKKKHYEDFTGCADEIEAEKREKAEKKARENEVKNPEGLMKVEDLTKGLCKK